MVKYVGSFIGGIVVGFAFLAMSSCVEKKNAIEGTDAGVVQPVESVGTMSVGAPTISSVPPATSEVAPVPVVTSVEQTVSVVPDAGVVTSEKK